MYYMYIRRIENKKIREWPGGEEGTRRTYIGIVSTSTYHTHTYACICNKISNTRASRRLFVEMTRTAKEGKEAIYYSHRWTCIIGSVENFPRFCTLGAATGGRWKRIVKLKVESERGEEKSGARPTEE